MTEEQVRAAMGQVAGELTRLRKEIRSLKYQITKNKKAGSPVDIDATLFRLSAISQRMAVLLEVTLKWRQLMIDDGIKVNA